MLATCTRYPPRNRPYYDIDIATLLRRLSDDILGFGCSTTLHPLPCFGLQKSILFAYALPEVTLGYVIVMILFLVIVFTCLLEGVA
jgi:hypothetical protein